MPTPAHRKIPDFPPPYAAAAAAAAAAKGGAARAGEKDADARPSSAPVTGRGAVRTRPLTPSSAAAGSVRARTPTQKQQRHDPIVLGDARRLQDRVITLKWLRMVRSPRIKIAIWSELHLNSFVLLFLSQVGVPLPLSTASKPNSAHTHTSIDPIQAAVNIHELFHDGFLLCRLAEILESITLPSIVIRPRTDAAKLANVDKALSVFQVTCDVFRVISGLLYLASNVLLGAGSPRFGLGG